MRPSSPTRCMVHRYQYSRHQIALSVHPLYLESKKGEAVGWHSWPIRRDTVRYAKGAERERAIVAPWSVTLDDRLYGSPDRKRTAAHEAMDGF